MPHFSLRKTELLTVVPFVWKAELFARSRARHTTQNKLRISGLPLSVKMGRQWDTAERDQRLSATSLGRRKLLGHYSGRVLA